MLLTAAMSTSIRAHSNNLGQAKAPRSADLSGCAATNVGDGATESSFILHLNIVTVDRKEAILFDYLVLCLTPLGT